MATSKRYEPPHPSGESCPFGFDFSPVIPPGVGIASGELDIYTNTQPPVAAASDWQASAVAVQDRTLYATLSGGKDGVDYILLWTATDTEGNIWPRAGLILCASTS